MKAESFKSEGQDTVRSSSEPHLLRDTHDTVIALDFDHLQVSISELDHSHQKEKASVCRSGSARQSRPPSRGSRGSICSSIDSLHLLPEKEELKEEETSRIVNIKVEIESDHKENSQRLAEVNKKYVTDGSCRLIGSDPEFIQCNSFGTQCLAKQQESKKRRSTSDICCDNYGQESQFDTKSFRRNSIEGRVQNLINKTRIPIEDKNIQSEKTGDFESQEKESDLQQHSASQKILENLLSRRRDSSESRASSSQFSQSSARSKSVNSLSPEDQSYHSLFYQAQSMPTLELEKEDVRTYLFGTNLVEPNQPHHIIRTSDDAQIQKSRTNTEYRNSYAFEPLENYPWAEPWVVLRTLNNQSKSDPVNTESEPLEQISPTNSFMQHSSSTGERDKFLELYEEVKRSVSSKENIVPQDKKILTTVTEETLSNSSPLPSLSRQLSFSTGNLDETEQANWVRSAKERRSLRSCQLSDQLSDQVSVTGNEPEWISRARKRLESMNVCLTSTTSDYNSVSSLVSESSIWSRGGLDALDDLRGEALRTSQEIAQEAEARVDQELKAFRESNKMLEYSRQARESSVERPRVSFEGSRYNVEQISSPTPKNIQSTRTERDSIKFGDLKHDWGNVSKQSLGSRSLSQKPTSTFALHANSKSHDDVLSPVSAESIKANILSSPSKLTEIRFGDIPIEFPAVQRRDSAAKFKFESVAGPDPTTMTAEQLNQNVEEYDFPIPTGKEDASILLKLLEARLQAEELVPEIVITDKQQSRPKSILKRRSVENVNFDLKKEELSMKQEHRKSASFDWDSTGKTNQEDVRFSNTISFRKQQFSKLVTNEQDTKKLQTINTNTIFNVKLRHVSPKKYGEVSANHCLNVTNSKPSIPLDGDTKPPPCLSKQKKQHSYHASDLKSELCKHIRQQTKEENKKKSITNRPTSQTWKSYTNNNTLRENALTCAALVTCLADKSGNVLYN